MIPALQCHHPVILALALPPPLPISPATSASHLPGQMHPAYGGPKLVSMETLHGPVSAGWMGWDVQAVELGPGGSNGQAQGQKGSITTLPINP